MTNKQKYIKAFVQEFAISESLLAEDLMYNSIPEWDSVGHMSLIACLEETFDIVMEMDDIIDFGSFNKGIEILAKYEVDFSV